MIDDNPNKVLLEDEILEDRLSQLPFDILVNILNLLTLDEAARTSVLSHKWKHLWKYTTILDFDASGVLMNVTEDTMEEDRNWYIYWVNEVLSSHRALYIDEFRINFDLDVSYESYITNWIYSAISRKVKRFELSFHPAVSWQTLPEIYTFPQVVYESLKTDIGLAHVKSLRSLIFDSVNITGEMLEFFIYNCPYLDQLDVACSHNLLGLKVVGSELKLKYLDIVFCNNLEELELSCPSLLSFKYFGPIIKFTITNVPQLQDVSIGGGVGGHGLGNGRVLGPIVNYFCQLKNLELFVELNEESIQFPKCELPALRHLTFQICARRCSSFLDLTCMLKSCPFLQKLTLKMQVSQYSSEVRSRHQFPKHFHRHLKEVDMIGFSGNPVELELARYLLENATALEQLLLEPWVFESEATIEAAREEARKLEEAILPPGVKLYIH